MISLGASPPGLKGYRENDFRTVIPDERMGGVGA